jgi:hypothetical protein
VEATPPEAEARPRRADGTHARELGGERIVYDPATHEVVVLNETAAFILDLCDGTRSLADMQRALEARYAAPSAKLRADLVATLADLRAKKLVSG